MVVEWRANTHTHTYEKKGEREGKDIDEVDLFEKINIVPWLPLPSLNGAQKSLLLPFFFFFSSLRSMYVIEIITHIHSVTHTDYTYRSAKVRLVRNMIMKNTTSTSILFQLYDLELVTYFFSFFFFFFTVFNG